MNNKNQFPLVSIVTPTYNQGKYLAETIESVLAQTYGNIEYIVLDDGSTDDTSKILDSFSGKIYHDRHENIGQAATLNYGWKKAKGSILGYLSSDDVLAPKAIEILVKMLLKNPSCSIVYCDYLLIDQNSKIFRNIITENFVLDRLQVDLVCQPGPGALFKREIFDFTGGWDQNLKQAPDFDFWLKASRFGNFVRVPEFLARYRVHLDSISFSIISVDQSNEIINIMTRYWSGTKNNKSLKSISLAHLMSSKHHAQSGRIGKMLSSCIYAVSLYPKIIYSMISWQLIISGIYRYFWRNCQFFIRSCYDFKRRILKDYL